MEGTLEVFQSSVVGHFVLVDFQIALISRSKYFLHDKRV